MIFYLNTVDSGYPYHVCEYSTYIVKIQSENEICSFLKKDSLFIRPYMQQVHAIRKECSVDI